MHLLRTGLLLIFLMPIASALASPPKESEAIRIGITPVFLTYQTAFLNDWKAYLNARLDRPVLFVQRNTYREITDLLLSEELDFAWICGYPFMRLRAQLRLAAVPTYQGEPLYRSYLIVPRGDSTTRSLFDLKGKIFAYSDPDSNSGYLVPQYQLATGGEDGGNFFAKAFFTWAHEKVVRAVADEVADGGAVDGYIWETLQRFQPELTMRTRVVSKSDSFGFPPLVARRGISEEVFSRVRQEFLNMQDNAQGRDLLARLNLDGFERADESLYASIQQMIETMVKP